MICSFFPYFQYKGFFLSIESQKAEDEDLKQNLFEGEEISVYNITDRQTEISGRESARVHWKREWNDQPVLLKSGLFLSADPKGRKFRYVFYLVSSDKKQKTKR